MIEGNIAKSNSGIKRMGGLLRTILPMATIAGGIYGVTRLTRSMITAAAEQERSLAQLRAGLESTGDSSGQTMASLRALSSEMQRTTTYGDELVESAAAIMLSFTNIADDVFPRAMKATADIATRMGTDLQSAVIQVSKALNEPVQNLGALSRAGIQFSKVQREMIKELWNTGQQADAQRLILAELERQYAGSAAGAKDTLGGALGSLKNSFGDLLEQIAPTGALVTGLNALAGTFDTLTDSMKTEESIILSTYELRKLEIAQWRNLGQITEDRYFQLLQEAAAEEQMRKIIAEHKKELIDRAKAAERFAEVSEKVRKKGQASLEAEIKLLMKENVNLLRGTDARILWSESLKWATDEQKETIEALLATNKVLKDNIDREKEAARAAENSASDRKRAAEEEVRIRKRLYQDAEDYRLRLLEQQYSGVDRNRDAWVSMAEDISYSFGGAVEDMIFDAKSFEDAMQDTIKQIARMLFQELVMKQITQAVVSGVTRGAGAGVQPITVEPQPYILPEFRRAKGGIIDRPTPFAAGGGRTGLMGENGPEAIMPLVRDDQGRLGVGGGGQQTLVMHIHTPDADSFRKSRGQVLNDARRGFSRMKG
jgi:phage-related minor tail protein